MSKAEHFNKKLLVEGKDDQHVVWALCEQFGVNETFDVVECAGIDKLMNQMALRFKQSDIQAIGVIIDADLDLVSRWQGIKAVLVGQGFSIPDALPLDGLVAKNENGLRLGVWVMPNNNVLGMLEDFVSFLVPPGDQLLPIVHSTLSKIEQNGLNKYELTHRSKAIIHTWLAWQEDPGTPMGLSITKRYLSTESEICKSLVGWMERLFESTNKIEG